MRLLLQGATVYRRGRLQRSDVSLLDGRVECISPRIAVSGFDLIFPLQGQLLTPGLVDVHVHLREPGFSMKETIASGTRAAARGGYTYLCAMPNLNPPPDTYEHLWRELTLIGRDTRVRVKPYGCLTRGQLGAGEPADYAALAPYVAGFSDDGRGVQDEADMRRVMEGVAAVDGLVAAHCEQNDLLHGGYIHDGTYCRTHGHRGICAESEWRPLERDLRLAKETGCRYHVCHVSCKESVALLRRAKGAGVDVTCETAPHYLLLCDEDLQEDGRFKMNPPLRGPEDRAALVEALRDGTIDMIATDHAPHTAEEKARGLEGSLMGVVGLECAFAVLHAGLVETGRLPLERLLEAMTDAPRKHFRLPPMDWQPGQRADLAAFDLRANATVNPDDFLSMGRATPFAGTPVHAECTLTLVGGETVWKR